MAFGFQSSLDDVFKFVSHINLENENFNQLAACKSQKADDNSAVRLLHKVHLPRLLSLVAILVRLDQLGLSRFQQRIPLSFQGLANDELIDTYRNSFH